MVSVRSSRLGSKEKEDLEATKINKISGNVRMFGCRELLTRGPVFCACFFVGKVFSLFKFHDVTDRWWVTDPESLTSLNTTLDAGFSPFCYSIDLEWKDLIFSDAIKPWWDSRPLEINRARAKRGRQNRVTSIINIVNLDVFHSQLSLKMKTRTKWGLIFHYQSVSFALPFSFPSSSLALTSVMVRW